MVAVAGVVFLFIILVTGIGLIIPAVIGLIVCKKLEKRGKKKNNLIFKILLSIGIVVIAIPLMYFYLIISNW
ncbi:MAG: hypothetical protein ACI39Q_00970 [Wujia sp.]